MNMSDESIFRLQKKFRAIFPEEAKLLDLAKSQDEIDELQRRFIDKAQQDVITSMKDADVSVDEIKRVSGGNFQNLPPILITNEQYLDLINASGHEIENQLHVLMDGLQRLQSLTGTKDKGLFIASMVAGGCLAFGVSTIIPALNILPVAILNLLGEIYEVSTFLVGAVLGLVTLLIFAIVLPLMHFSDKPANCIVLVINELNVPLFQVEDHNIHGHMTGATAEITPAGIDSDGNLLPSIGFMSCVKDKGSFYGSQMGFVLSIDHHTHPDSIPIAFGVENPLTLLYKANNCFCDFHINAKEAAESTDKNNKQECSKVHENQIAISIKCNSKSGSTAYYIARVYNTRGKE